MPSAETINLAALLAPIAGDNPAGQSIRYTGTYDAIQDARRADDALEQGDWKREIKKANWHAVAELAADALRTKSKDLQLAAWLTEALVKEDGFAGLRDGICLLRALQERFWPTLYPEIEDGDLDFRAAPLTWLNEKVPPSIRSVRLTQDRDGNRYSWLHWHESRTVDNLARQSPEAFKAARADGKITSDEFDASVAATPAAYYDELFEDLNQCTQECEQLNRVIDEKFGRDAPSVLNIKKAIDDCRTLVADIVRKKGGALGPEVGTPVSARLEDVGAAAEPSSGVSMAAVPASGSVPLEPRDRADALRRLAAVAAFFRRSEPHSPVAYLVQRAVKWGEMPLDHWLKEVIRDDTVLANVRETLGLKDSSGEKTE